MILYISGPLLNVIKADLNHLNYSVKNFGAGPDMYSYLNFGLNLHSFGFTPCKISSEVLLLFFIRKIIFLMKTEFFFSFAGK